MVTERATPLRIQAASARKTTRKREAPTVDWLMEEATKLEQFWESQKKRMEADQDLYELFREEPAEGESNMVLNLPRVHLNKVKRMIAGAEWRPVFDADEEQPKPSSVVPFRERSDSATVKEQFLLWCWDRADEEWRDGLNTGLKSTLTHHALLRGMIALRVKPAAEVDDSDLSSPLYELTPIDPLLVYPRLVGRKIRHVLHIYQTEWAAIEEEWGIVDEGKEPDTTVKVVGYYDDTYWAIAVDGEYLKEPEEHKLGFNPLLVHSAEGGETRGKREATSSSWTEFVGTGMLQDNRQAYKDRNRVATQRDELITRSINPAVLVWTKDGDPKVIDLRSGASTSFDAEFNEKAQLLTPGASSGDIAKMEADLDGDIQLGSVPQVLFGAVDSPMAGYAISLQSKGARDILTPWLECLKGLIRRTNICLLKMMTSTEVGLRSAVQVRGNSSKLGRFRAQITADQLGDDFAHDVEFGDILPSDLPGLIDMGIKAVNAEVPLFDAATWLEKFGQSITNDPEKVFRRILRERASLKAGVDVFAQLGAQALLERVGEEGMKDIAGDVQKAPQPGLQGSTLPAGEATGAPPTQIEPGSPEEAAIAQRMAAGVPPRI